MKNVDQLILKAVPSFQHLAESFREAESRPVRTRAVKVVDYKPTNPKAVKQLVAPGTATAFFVRKGSKLLKEIEKAAQAGNGSDEAVAGRLEKLFASRAPVSLQDAVKSLQSQPVFGDLQYGRTTLAKNIFVPEDFELCVIPFPYNGGRLADEGFTLVERYKDSATQLDALILRYPPPLSRAEAAALKKIPASQLELNVGTAGIAASNTVEIVLMVLLYMLLMQPGDLVEQHIDERRLSTLDASSTARELLQLRRNVLSRARA